MKKGSLFTRRDLAADVQTIRTVYLEKGYADVQVRFDQAHMAPEPGQKIYDLNYMVNEGPLYHIDLIRPRGNDKTKPAVITREMAISPGDRYDIRKIKQSIQRLRKLGYFSKVEVRAVGSRRVEPGKKYKELYVHVEEKGTSRLMLGVGGSSTGGVFGDLRFRDTNFDLSDTPRSWSDFVSGSAFAGGGQTLAVFLQPGTETSRFGFRWCEPWLNQRPVELGLSAAYSSREWDEYTVDKLGGSVTLGKRYPPTLTGFVGLRIHEVDVTDVDSDAPPDVRDDKGTHEMLGVSVGVTRNTLDKLTLPTSGKKYTLSAELVGDAGLDALKLIAEGRKYKTVHEAPDKSKHVVSLWGRTSVIAGSDLPVFERFYAGGLGSVRGFAAHGISPTYNGDPIGGEFKIEGGVEYLFPFIKDTARGVVFLDAGSVADDSFDIGDALSDMRASTGVGLELVLPAAGGVPLAMYLGVPLKKESGDETEAFTFSLGIFLP